MIILAIDPGNIQSAWMFFDTETNAIKDCGITENNELLKILANRPFEELDYLAIEMIACYGMAVGKSVFDTCVWIGRFVQFINVPHQFIYRKDEKICLCNSTKAKDANIRQALIDLYGGNDKAIGNKKNPGPLYGIKADLWAALAVAVTFTKNHASVACEK